MTETVEPGAAEQSHARRVAESKATVPHIYLEAEVEPGEELSTEAVIAAVAASLRDAPRVNGVYRDGRYETRPEANVGVATPAQDTVLYPVIRDADRKEGTEVARELEELAARARSGEITQPELSGATFSLADLRSQGISRASGIVRRGQAAYLTVGQPDEGRLSLTLACDARIVHGPEAAEFLAAVAARLS